MIWQSTMDCSMTIDFPYLRRPIVDGAAVNQWKHRVGYEFTGCTFLAQQVLDRLFENVRKKPTTSIGITVMAII